MKKYISCLIIICLITFVGCRDVKDNPGNTSNTENANTVSGNNESYFNSTESGGENNFNTGNISEPSNNSSETDSPAKIQKSKNSVSRNEKTDEENIALKENNSAAETPSKAGHSEQDDSVREIGDEVFVADKVLELLNAERKALGINERTMLSGLNKVAVLRSKQLVTQFSHKWIDEDGNEWSGAQYASTILKYGQKEQSSVFDPETGTVIPTDEYYYDYGGTENCYYGGTALRPKSEIAESIVASFKGSSEHWNSLMSNSMKYDGIGITFKNNIVYCSVNSSAVNYG